MDKDNDKIFQLWNSTNGFFESLKKNKFVRLFFWTRFSDLDCSLLFYRQHLLRREKHRYLEFYKCGLNSASIGLRHKKMTDLSQKFFTSLKIFKTAEQSRFQGLESSVPLWLKNCALKKKTHSKLLRGEENIELSRFVVRFRETNWRKFVWRQHTWETMLD